MREALLSFANEYAAEKESNGLDADELRSINHPLVFLFLGDQADEALRQVFELNRKRWNNSAGVVYLQVGTRPAMPGDSGTDGSGTDNGVYFWPLEGTNGEKKTVRAELYKQFYGNESKLLELNVILRRMNNRISAFGRSYSNMQRLNIAVVTEADDPASVLVPELTVLMRSIFGEHFRSVQMDLYTLLQEKQVGESFALSSSFGVSFLREVDQCQSRDYTFRELLQVTGEGIRLPAQHGPAPLFDMVYLFSDKDERGIFAESGMQGTYEMICSLNLLKNRKVPGELDPQHGAYNNQQFRQNMTPPDADGRCYVSAGYSRVQRPNQAIALTVLYHVYRKALHRLQENSAGLDTRERLELLELEPHRSDDRIRSLMAEHSQALDGMYGLLYHNVSASELRGMTLRQAEAALYGGNAQTFFETNVVRRVEAGFALHDGAKSLARLFTERVLAEPKYGFFSGAAWTDERESGSIPAALREQLRETTMLLAQGKAELEQKYAEGVELQGKDRRSLWSRLTQQLPVKEIVRRVLDDIYGLKLELLALHMKQQLLELYLNTLEGLHARMKQLEGRAQQLERTLHEASRSSIHQSHRSDYLGRNINEYYGHVVDIVVKELEERRGASYFCNERSLGNVSILLEQGEDKVVQRLVELCRKDVFVHPLFDQTFEGELLERANVAASYDNRDVLSKEDLYRDLYATLENEAAIRADVYRSTHRHRYEEKYLFGDYHSEFVQYAYAVDHGSRTYKLGCVHERKPSGIEKLNLMGGFRIEDLMYYRNGKLYYDTYVENGFVFHGKP
ncbi:hypothetical protein [Paenibacillus rigui]|uniref:Transcription initiation factor TFIID n=1 Tax=Paenibacillus rigui TaxID=554312 RepID=A0A229UK20_9BACL|nr:hypothetical protein [Paenibacillus rigui]OXM83746.1 hypothetical protein CF651_24460 [Paenibacillus rigui]